MLSEDSERGQKEKAAAASLELPDQRLPPKTKTKRTERWLANGPLAADHLLTTWSPDSFCTL